MTEASLARVLPTRKKISVRLSEESAKAVAGWEIPKHDCGSLGCHLARPNMPQHVCCIYENEENHVSILRSYLLGGLLNNEKILLAVERKDIIGCLLSLLKDLIFVETEDGSMASDDDGNAIKRSVEHERSIYDFYERGQIVFMTYNQSYLVDDCFVADRVAGQIKAFAEEAEKEGYSGCRLSAGPPIFLVDSSQPGIIEEFVQYEAKINFILEEVHNCTIWCLYDRTHLPQDFMMRILYSHSTAVIKNEICENIYYVPPEELLSKHQFQEAALNHWMYNLIERKRLKDELARLKEELKLERSRRTGDSEDTTSNKEKEEDERRKAQEEEEVNNAKAKFLATICHEIRAPLTGIIGTCALLTQSKDLTPEQKELATMIQASGDHLSSVINDVLTFSKQEFGKFALEWVPFDLKQFLRSTLSLCKVVASQRQLTIDSNLETEPSIPTTIRADPTRLRQVLFNLVTNSLKFTPAGGRISMNIHVSEQPTPASQGNNNDPVILTFSVSDTGIGIPQDKFEHIFHSFSQIERKYGGTGLGLSISKNFVEAWNGRIWVESELGKGSTFSFTLPTEIVKEPVNNTTPGKLLLSNSNNTVPLAACLPFFKAPSPAETNDTIDDGSDFSEGYLSIMVADDNVINQKVLCKMLECIGRPPEVVLSNGEEVVNEIEKRRRQNSKQIDVILMDLEMPVMNGIEASRRIAQYSDWGSQHKPIVVGVTAGNLTEQQRREVDMEYHLPKPFKMQALDALLKEIAGGPTKDRHSHHNR